MRTPDNEETRRHPKLGTITVRTWNEPEQESYESVFGKGEGVAPPGPNEEFWSILVKVTTPRYPSLEGFGSLGMVGTDGSQRSLKYFRATVKEVEKEAISDLVSQVERARATMGAAKARTIHKKKARSGSMPHGLKALGFKLK